MSRPPPGARNPGQNTTVVRAGVALIVLGFALGIFGGVAVMGEHMGHWHPTKVWVASAIIALCAGFLGIFGGLLLVRRGRGIR